LWRSTLLRLKADVREHVGRTTHLIGNVQADGTLNVEHLPDPVWVEIRGDQGMFYLLRFSQNGTCCADTCHQTVDEAKAQAEFEFGIPTSAWIPVDK
jgi:hypothetical protein